MTDDPTASARATAPADDPQAHDDAAPRRDDPPGPPSGRATSPGAEDAARDESPSPDGGTVPVRRLVRALVVVVPLGALAYTLLFAAPGFDQVGAAIRDLRPRSLLLALVGEVVYVTALAQAYRAALASLGVAVPYRTQLRAFLAGYGVGPLLPAGGAVGGMIVAQRTIVAGAPRAAAVAAVTLTGVLSLLGVAVLVSGGLVLTGLLGGARSTLVVAALVAGLVLSGVTAGVVAVIRRPSWGHRILDRLERPMRRLGADLDAWRSSLDRLPASPPRLPGILQVVAWAVIAWAGNATVLWAVFWGLGEALTPDVLLLVFGLQHLVAMIPVTPSGLGFVEAGMAGTLTALGVAGSAAVTGVVGYRLVAFWLPVAVGMTVYLRTAGDGAGERERAAPG